MRANPPLPTFTMSGAGSASFFEGTASTSVSAGGEVDTAWILCDELTLAGGVGLSPIASRCDTGLTKLRVGSVWTCQSGTLDRPGALKGLEGADETEDGLQSVDAELERLNLEGEEALVAEAG